MDEALTLVPTLAPSVLLNVSSPSGPPSFSRGQQQGQESGDDSGEHDTYEFVAFILWYTFLILCCIVPTCCAYRRRRLLESRYSEQQRASFERLQQLQNQAQQNMFILSNLHQLRASAVNGDDDAANRVLGIDNESLLNERTRRIKVALKGTTFVVKPEDIIQQQNDGNSQHALEETGGIKQQQITSSEIDEANERIDCEQSIDETEPTTQPSNESDEEQGDGLGAVENSGSTVDVTSNAMEYYDADALNMDHCLLQLPQSSTDDCDAGDEESQTPVTVSSSDPPQNANRTVPGGCAICLSAYEVGDSVSWSTLEGCVHAFHTDCIVPWLAKKNEPNCPCCRRTFCMYARIQPTEMLTITPLGLVSSSMLSSSLMSHHPALSARRFIYPVSDTTTWPEPVQTNNPAESAVSTVEANSVTEEAVQTTLEIDDVEQQQQQQQEEETESRNEDRPTVVSPDLVESHQILEQRQHLRDRQR